MSDAPPPAPDAPSETAPAGLLRPATAEDAPFLGRLWAEAFPGERDADERTRALLADLDPYGGLDEAWVARVDGEPVGGLRTYRLRLHLGGRVHPTLGLGAVAVLEGRRGRGIGRRICEEALRIGRARGAALSLLYPFRADFYARLGYASVGERHRYRFPLSELRARAPGAEEGGSAAEATEDGGRVVRLSDADGWDEPAAVYGRVARRSDGMLERQGRHWRRLERPGHVRLVHREGGRATGYAVVGDRGDGLVRVVELVAESEAGRLRLLRSLGGTPEGWSVVEHDAFPSERLDRWLGHPVRVDAPGREGLWYESAGRLRGPMIRVLHPGQVTTDGPELALDDAVLPANRGRWKGGERLSDDPGPDALGPGAAAVRLVAAARPGRGAAEDGLRLLDEF